jgi:hypothetical protein
MNLKTASNPAEPRDLKSPFPDNRILQQILTVAANPALPRDLKPSLSTMMAI